MARHASTYRQSRRADYAEIRSRGGDLTWQEVNSSIKSLTEPRDQKRFGPVRSDYAGGAHFLGGRSKYMPHIGKKQRAKGD